MPKATPSTEPVHVALKTCPGGFVDLLRMSYGQKTTRAEMAMSTAMKGDPTKKGGDDVELVMAIAQTATTLFEFNHCVVDHNLYEDDEERVKLDFKSPNILDKLDPRIGEEIALEIGKLNNYEEVDQGNSGTDLPS